MHASGRNSGVVHSGFNPKPGTLKARLCIEGNRRLAEYAQANGVPFRRVGTFVIARSESEAKVIEILRRNGVANGVPGIEIISGDALRKHEPNALGDAALYAPTGAIIDSISFVQSLAESAKKQGAEFLFGCRVNDIREMANHVEISTDAKRISAAFVVNCAGVYADKIAHAMGIGLSYAIIPFRGEYYEVKSDGVPLIRSMVYPAPDLAFPFLGVHLTASVDGRVLIGPNAVPAFGREAYFRSSLNLRELAEELIWKGTWNLLKDAHARRTAIWEIKRSLSKKIFATEASTVVKGVRSKALRPYRAGIRAQLVSDNGRLVEDMVIERTAHSLHLLNVVSPGMTCSIPFAEHVSGLIA
jgi:L-2-hydroxyglutarate oxidase LhgO